MRRCESRERGGERGGGCHTCGMACTSASRKAQHGFF